MAAKNYPLQVGDLVRHHPSGLPVRVDRVLGSRLNLFTVLFSDGEIATVHLVDLEFNLTDEERRRFARDLPIVQVKPPSEEQARRKP